VVGPNPQDGRLAPVAHIQSSYLKTVIFVHSRGDQKVIKTATHHDELLLSLRNSFSESGRGGIRTHGALTGTPDFESGTFDHSATLPSDRVEENSGKTENGKEAIETRKLDNSCGQLKRRSAIHYDAPVSIAAAVEPAFLGMAIVSGLHVAEEYVYPGGFLRWIRSVFPDRLFWQSYWASIGSSFRSRSWFAVDSGTPTEAIAE
jgi:hypothetical protein